MTLKTRSLKDGTREKSEALFLNWLTLILCCVYDKASVCVFVVLCVYIDYI